MTKPILICLSFFCLSFLMISAIHPHPNLKSIPLFKPDLSDAIAKQGVWTVIDDSVFTANADESLWSAKEYTDFVLDLDFKTADNTNSGVIVHASNIQDWIPHSVEIQIADDFSKEWYMSPATWQCAAIFGHQAAYGHFVKEAGEWNHYQVTCKGRMITIMLNGKLANKCDMSRYTSSKENPDGSPIPGWLENPMATLPLKGHIGFQGKHAGAPIYFKHIMIKEI